MTKLDSTFQQEGLIDGDQLAAPTATKRGGVKATGTPSGKFLKDDDTWAVPGGVGDVVGPSSAIDNRIAVFNGVTGKLVKDGGSVIADLAPLAHNQAASTINSGTLDAARIPSLAASIIASGTFDGNRLPVMSSTKLGGVPATGTPSGKVLNDYGSWVISSGSFYIVSPGGGANDQVAINAALASYYYVALVPGASYHINGKIDFGAKSGTVLDGLSGFQSYDSTRIYADVNNIDAIDMGTGRGNVVKNLWITPNSGITMVYPTSAIVIDGNEHGVENIRTQDMFTSVNVLQGVLSVVKQCDFYNVHGWGVIMYGNDCSLIDLTMWGMYHNPLGGIYAYGCANLIVDRCNIMACGASFHFINVMCAKVHETYFDQGNQHNIVEAESGHGSRHIEFIDCWFAGVSYASPVNVLLLVIQGPGYVYDVKVSGGQFRDSYGNIISVSGPATDIYFNNIEFVNGGRASVGSIINLTSAASKISIVGCKYYEDSHVNNMGAVYTDNSVNYVIHTLNDWHVASSGVSGSLGANNVNVNNL